MNADGYVFWICVALATFMLGYKTRIWSEEKKAEATPAALYGIKPAPIQRVGLELLGCPVTRERLEEYARVCRGRARLDAVKPKQGE